MSLADKLRTRIAAARTTVAEENIVDDERKAKLLDVINKNIPREGRGAISNVEFGDTRFRALSCGKENVDVCIASFTFDETRRSASGEYDVNHEVLAVSNSKGAVLYIDSGKYASPVANCYLLDENGNIHERTISSYGWDMKNISELRYDVKDDKVSGFLDRYAIVSSEERESARKYALRTTAAKAITRAYNIIRD